MNPLGVSVIMIQANKYKGKGIMRKLLIYLNEYRKECILAPLFKLLEASFELVVPLVVAAIIDHGIAEQTLRTDPSASDGTGRFFQ